MKRMAASHILVIGLSGLGVEIAKNVCLAGVKSVTLSDATLVTLPDLGTQFFLRASDVGLRRDLATRPRLAELNAYTPVSVLEEVTEDALRKYTVIVLVGGSTEDQIKLNDFTHDAGIKFIKAEAAGLFGSAFCDFGKQFPVVDQTGEAPLTGMVVEIEESEEAMVTCLDETRHGLEDGDYVRFSEVEGMDINSVGVEGARKVTVKGECGVLLEWIVADEVVQVPTRSLSETLEDLDRTRREDGSTKSRCPSSSTSYVHPSIIPSRAIADGPRRNLSASRSLPPNTSSPISPSGTDPAPSTSVSKPSPPSVPLTLAYPPPEIPLTPRPSSPSPRRSQPPTSSRATSTRKSSSSLRTRLRVT